MNEEGQLVYAGDVDIGVWSPFDIVVPSYPIGQVDLHSMPWVIKAKWRDLSYITANFKRGKEVVAETRPSPIVGVNLVLGRDTPMDSRVPGAVLKELKLQPCPEFPKGVFITGSNGIILQKTDYPYDYYNLEHFKDIDIPGMFWGKSTVDSALPQQIRWNRTNNSIDEFNKTAAKGKLLTPRGSRVEIQPSDQHGEIIYYKPVMGHKPDWLNLKPLPGSITNALEVTRGSIQDQFSQHEITMGTNRPDLRSGDMVARLREQDAHGAIPTHAVFEESMEGLSSRLLRRVAKGYTTQRMIKVTGRDNEYEVFAFKGADLRDNTDVLVQRQSSMPDSRIDREAEIMKRYEAGLYGDPTLPEVRREVLNMLDDVPDDPDYAEVKLDEMYAAWENKVLTDTNVDAVLVNGYDNHAVHLRVHNRYRKSLDYQKLKLQNYKAFMAFEQKFNAHASIHQEFVEQAMMEALERRQELEGR